MKSKNVNGIAYSVKGAVKVKKGADSIAFRLIGVVIRGLKDIIIQVYILSQSEPCPTSKLVHVDSVV